MDGDVADMQGSVKARRHDNPPAQDLVSWTGSLVSWTGRYSKLRTIRR